MNAQLQGVYGGNKVRHSVFRGQELRERRSRVIKILVLALFIATIIWCVFNITDARAQQQQSNTAEITVIEPSVL